MMIIKWLAAKLFELIYGKKSVKSTSIMNESNTSELVVREEADIEKIAKKLTEEVEKDLKKYNKKPPIGIIPRWLHNEHRICDLKKTVKKAIETDNYNMYTIAWITEIIELENNPDESIFINGKTEVRIKRGEANEENKN